jgi:3-oxoacyl-(acyl-carrier-protein) synthase
VGRDGDSAVVVTGFSAVTPAGNDREATWRNLVAGNSAVGPITAFDASSDPARIAAEVRGFEPAALLDRKQQRRTARFSQLAIAAAREAVAAALSLAGHRPAVLAAVPGAPGPAAATPAGPAVPFAELSSTAAPLPDPGTGST